MRDNVSESIDWDGPRTWAAGKRSPWLCGIAVVLLTAAIGMLLSVQGWRSRIPLFDLVTYVHSTHDLLATGTLPQHGDTGSYGNFKPPGTAWLMVPSALTFADPRLSEYVGTGCLYLAGLIGIFLLARFFLGIWCACLSVLLYGLSQHGLFFAGSLWPNGRPEFYVWIVYFTVQWVTRRDPKYVAFAATIWAVGMHVDMAIAPAFFIFPALWLFYRPPLRLRPLIIGGNLALIIWYPYLRFESSRNFVDVRSMLLLEDIRPVNYTDSWCNPNLTLQTWQDTSGSPHPIATSTHLQARNRLAELVNSKIIAPATKLPSNFQPAYLADRATIGPAAGVLLLLLTIISILVLAGSRFLRRAAEVMAGRSEKRVERIAVSIILLGLVANEFLFARYLSADGILEPSTISWVRSFQVGVVLAGITMLILRKQLATILKRFVTPAGEDLHAIEPARDPKLLAVTLLIPWLILLIVAEPGKPERFWWLWPVQIIFLAALVTNVLRRARAPWPVGLLSLVLIAGAVLYNPLLVSRIASWSRFGWAGFDAPEIQAVDYLATQIRSSGRDRTAIGYQVFIYPFMAEYNVANPEYKVGADFDLLLKYRHGIINRSTCAEGISRDDEYRVIQTHPKYERWRPRQYFDANLGSSFRMVRQFDLYRILTRTDSSVANDGTNGVPSNVAWRKTPVTLDESSTNLED